jgi:hypothetical protein
MKSSFLKLAQGKAKETFFGDTDPVREKRKLFLGILTL